MKIMRKKNKTLAVPYCNMIKKTGAGFVICFERIRRSESILKSHGSADPEPNRNLTDPRIRIYTEISRSRIHTEISRIRIHTEISRIRGS
jgi:hypothetical protein